ncbi:MAG: hypothetical protein KAR30_06760 [Gammaproteobacteria bacterium]|nr:hypothetical protein [Gammaproteobacteria bacterium]
MRGPMQSMMIIAVFAVLSMLQPPLTWPFGYLSGGAVALVTLHVGLVQGLLAMAGAAVGCAVIAYLVLQAPTLAVLFVLMIWLPVWILAAVLRYSRSLSLSLQLATLLGIAVVVIAFIIMQDPVAIWLEALQQLKPQLLSAYEIPEQDLDSMLELAARIMTGSASAFLVLGLMISLIIGRGWQALLFNSGGFKEEFCQMRFTRVVGFVTLALMGIAFYGNQPLALNIVIVLSLAYVVYGLAVTHGLVIKLGAGSGWLTIVYALLVIIPPQVMLLLSLLGLADIWVDFRTRFART